MKVPSKEQLQGMTVSAIRAHIRQYNHNYRIKGYSTMKKAQLIDHLSVRSGMQLDKEMDKSKGVVSGGYKAMKKPKGILKKKEAVKPAKPKKVSIAPNPNPVMKGIGGQAKLKKKKENAAVNEAASAPAAVRRSGRLRQLKV